MKLAYLLTGIFLLSTSLSAQQLEFSSRNFCLSFDHETAISDFNNGLFQVVGEEVYYLNKITQAIKVFSLIDGQVSKTIKLEKIGPSAVGPQVEVFHVISRDSILVFSEFFKNEVSLIDRNSQIINTFSSWPENSMLGDYQGEMLSKKTGAIQVMGSYIYLAHCIYNKRILKGGSMITSVDMSNGEVRILDELPSYGEMVDVDRLIIVPAFLSPDLRIRNDELIVNYPVSDDVFSLNLKRNEVYSYSGKSQFMNGVKMTSKEVNAYSNKAAMIDEMRSISTLSGYYWKLLYDPFRSVFYRVVRLPYNEGIYRKYKSGLLDRLTESVKYSVILLDTELNVLSENEFSADEYNFSKGVFVTEDGLFVYDEAASSEDKVVFANLIIKQ